MRNRPQRNNNPGNVRWAKQPEASGKDDAGYAIFPTPEAGWRKLHGIIKFAANKGYNITEFINEYAPPVENDTRNYVGFVCNHMNCGPFTPLIDLSEYALGGVMAQMEGYYAKTT